MTKHSMHFVYLTIGHVAHGFLLLAPTLFLSGTIDIQLIGFSCVVLLAGVLESCQTGRHSNHSKNGDAVIRRPQDLVALNVAQMVGALMLCLFWMSQIECFYFARNSFPVFSLGLFLSTVGIALRLVAIQTLGGRFQSDIVVPKVIEVDGIYRWLKHPSEFGLILIVVGVPLILCSVFASVAAIAVFVPISIWRMRRENVELAKHELQPDAS